MRPEDRTITSARARFAPYAWLVLGSVCISFSPVFVKLAHVGPTTAAFWRMAIGGLALALAAALRGGFTFGGAATLGLALACAVAFGIDLVAWHTAIHLIGPGMATILANIQVVLLAAWGVAVLGERGLPRLVASLLLAATGIWLLFGPDWAARPEASLWGLMLGIVAAISYAAFLIFLRRLQTRQNFSEQLRNMAFLGLLTAALLAGAALLGGESLAITSLNDLAALSGYGLLGQALGWTLIAANLPRVPLSSAGLVILLQPTLAFGWDVLLFGRRAGIPDLLGAGLALGAIFLGATRRK